MSDPTGNSDATPGGELLRTPLYDLHAENGAKFVPFAGYEMPVQYPLGVMKEHIWTRDQAGLFDVSHMGQIEVRARSGQVVDAARALEALVPADLISLPVNRQRYTVLTNEAGGILDDLMVANLGDRLVLIVNAACKDADEIHLRTHLSDTCELTRRDDLALLALQGPLAVDALSALWPGAAKMKFMDVREAEISGCRCVVSRSGYTGEDGYEISCPADKADAFARQLLGDKRVTPVGLGARDSLRLEAGLPLYGSDLDLTTTPLEAGLSWAVGKSRRPGGARAGGYPGADRIGEQFASGVARTRVGLRPEGRAPIRGGTALFANEGDADEIGTVTSGSFAPSLDAPIAFAYLPNSAATPGTRLFAEVRGKRMPVRVVDIPFVEHSYKR